jgi:uncharacterized repeat protein (TIGR03837 family)
MSGCRRWDIFCKVVDNFGDAGVTWRLARQLVHEFDREVCLWLDDLAPLRLLAPGVDPAADDQQITGVTIRRWHTEQLPPTDADVVIEAFACHLPEMGLPALAARTPPPVWLNLEYLSAEDWVNDCHGLPSIHPQLPLTKYFFFPGFGVRTGGLLREQNLLAQRQAFRRDPTARTTFLANIGVQLPESTRLFSLFSYESPAIAHWLEALSTAARPTLCLVPDGRAVPAVADWLGQPVLLPGDRYGRGAVTVQVLPFLSQDSYDRLLWCCDFNMVRGEDSCVRAQWAGQPFGWHIYAQVDAAHLPKLEAFHALYTATLSPALAAALQRFALAWSGDGKVAAAWAELENHWPEWQQGASEWAAAQGARTDLATALVDFCEAHR